VHRPLSVVFAIVVSRTALTAQNTSVSLITVVRHHLHSQSTDNSSVIRTLPRNTTVTVFRLGAVRSDFLHVATSPGDARWLAFAYVR
jgi:hypothetical protein